MNLFLVRMRPAHQKMFNEVTYGQLLVSLIDMTHDQRQQGQLFRISSLSLSLTFGTLSSACAIKEIHLQALFREILYFFSERSN